MRARAFAFALLAILLASCSEAPASSSPTLRASGASVPSPSSGASASAAPTGETRIPLEAGTFPANADAEALIVTRRLIDGRTTSIESIDLRTRATSPVHETVDASVTAPSIRDGVLTLLETAETDAPMVYRMRVLAGRWRDPSSFTALDEFTVEFVGGDSWNPYPDPQTNGWEVAWLHTTPDRTFEVRLREADGRVHAIYSSKTPFSFALGRSGDVAIGDLGLPGQTAAIALRLFSGGALRTLLERPVTGAGHVLWQDGRIVWTNGTGLATPIPSVERITPTTLSRETIATPPGCGSFMGATDQQLAFACGDHVELTGGPTQRVGPPIPLIHARAMIRTEEGPPAVAVVIPVLVDEPRPGAGARF
jgi:hypothetical protein